MKKTISNYQDTTPSIKPYKVEEVNDGCIEYRKIQAWQSCDWDGEPSNWVQGTKDGDRWLTEKRFVPNKNSGVLVRYTNYW